MADALMVEPILVNLADNACKYAAPDSEPKKLILNADSSGSRLLISVRDFGPGLSPRQKKKLFHPFSKSASEAAHSAPGIGLGLALSRRMARRMGGELAHETPASGQGASFVLSLPKT